MATEENLTFVTIGDVPPIGSEADIQEENNYMGDVIQFPIKPETPGITGRDGYIVAEALYFAAKWIEAQPEHLQRKSDREDMLAILNVAFPGMAEMFET